MSLGVLFGQFVGAALAECAPVLIEIILEIYYRIKTPTVEDGATRPALRERLNAVIKLSKSQNNHSSERGTSSNSKASEGVGLGS